MPKLAHGRGPSTSNSHLYSVLLRSRHVFRSPALSPHASAFPLPPHFARLVPTAMYRSTGTRRSPQTLSAPFYFSPSILGKIAPAEWGGLNLNATAYEESCLLRGGGAAGAGERLGSSRC